MLLLAAGLDPERCILFVQSHVPLVTELTWILNGVATVGELRRMTQFKEKGQGQESVSAGLFDYPVLMAADILLYDTDEVPVGDDQTQHVELARDIAIRFNHRFGDTLVVPKATIPPVGARIKDLQHPEAKMSKSVESPQGTILRARRPAGDHQEGEVRGHRLRLRGPLRPGREARASRTCSRSTRRRRARRSRRPRPSSRARGTARSRPRSPRRSSSTSARCASATRSSPPTPARSRGSSPTARRRPRRSRPSRWTASAARPACSSPNADRPASASSVRGDAGVRSGRRRRGRRRRRAGSSRSGQVSG